jgi:hypothetical protein
VLCVSESGATAGTLFASNDDRIEGFPQRAKPLDLVGGNPETLESSNARTQGTSPLAEDGDPGRNAVAAPRLGVPGRSAPRERTCDAQIRRLVLKVFLTI